jgi:uncharacterized protein DUF1488
MSGISLSNPVAKVDGVEFTATRGDEERRFLAHREALQDLDYSVFETAEALLKAFDRHQGQIAKIAGGAMDQGDGDGRTVVLHSLL